MSEEKAAPETRKAHRQEKEIEIAASVDDVWKALTEPEQLAGWMALDARVEPGVGGKVFISWGPDCEFETPIVAWEPGKRIAWEDDLVRVEFTLESRGGKTILKMVQSGFFSGADWEKEWYDSTDYGWMFMLISLRFLVEEHRGVKRQVRWPKLKVAITREDAYAKLMAAGGLFREDAAHVLKKDHAYSLTTLDGQQYSGHVEMLQSPRGFCISISQLGNALLWLTIEGGKKADVQLWLSTFGQPEAELDGFQQVWQQRLEKLFA
jgi:uncharacterized protein YndB with AHSA1/START domain